jgi:hypothetical protein
MKTTRNKRASLFVKALLPSTTLALIASLAIASCAQDVKITAPRYALVYGVKNYQDPVLPDLTYTIADATSIALALGQQGWTTTLSTESQAKRTSIVADIQNLATTIGTDATVLVYFSGHGGLSNDGSTALIAPWDFAFARVNGFIVYKNGIAQIDESTTISAPELSTMLAALPTKNIIVIFDSCNSGGFVATGSAVDASPQDYSSMPSYSAFSTAMSNFGNLLVANASASGGKTPIVLSAAGSAELSWESSTFPIPPDTGHGVFTYYLLHAVTNGDSDGDGFVTMTEAYAYTVSAMKAGWNSNPANVAFLPHLSGGTRDLVLFSK